ncbi:DyP [Metarhizium guizhouense ARSEF 977]|uniref:DyP n=1 Tax=Metarhizium guizhouense (strain ARSEF 977) TaxID=1276136 RepID=A0A0B4GCH7_METGA|nr:DyP [Metarhizium guizhouense ARSEF 977]
MKAKTADGKTGYRLLPIKGVNIAFSAKRIQKMGITDDIKDDIFTKGMRAGAEALGNRPSTKSRGHQPDWDAMFLQEIHGLILITGERRFTINQELKIVKDILCAGGTPSVKEIATIIGDVRPGDQSGHEHFGYRDGISQPAIKDFGFPLPGQTTIEQGTILLGREGDKPGQPNWALDGSFLAFRKLSQLVPEFDK